MTDPTPRRRTTRRRFLAGAGALTLALTVRPAAATPESMEAAIREVLGNAKLNQGRVKIDVPPLVENGNTVPLSIAVESPMTEAEHVKKIHVFNEKNPLPQVATFHLGPRSGAARVSTRVRLADTQDVVAIAEMSDGTFWTASAHVIVTLAACNEDVI